MNTLEIIVITSYGLLVIGGMIVAFTVINKTDTRRKEIHDRDMAYLQVLLDVLVGIHDKHELEQFRRDYNDLVAGSFCGHLDVVVAGNVLKAVYDVKKIDINHNIKQHEKDKIQGQEERG